MTFTKPSNLQLSAPIWILLRSISKRGQTESVANEEMIRAHAMFALHRPVQHVLEILGVKGQFVMSGSGNVPIVGAPDFSWITRKHAQLHPKVVVRDPSLLVCVLLNLPGVG